MSNGNMNIEVLFETKTYNISINKEEKDLYNKFIDALKIKIDKKEKDNKKLEYKLMSINTKEMYLIINEDNFLEILNEKTKEGKIKLFLDIVEIKEEDNLIQPLEEDMIGGINIKNDDADDFNEKLSLSRSNEIITIKNKDVEKENIVDLGNKNNIKNEDKEYKESETKTLITPLSALNNKNDKKEDLNIVNNSKSNIINQNENIQNDKIKQNNTINSINNQNNNNINNIIENDNNSIEIIEICSICKKVIKDKIKFDCCICDKLTLCQNCEKNHEHPCIKFKIGETILSTLNDCHSFISQKHKFSGILPIKYIKNIFNNTFDILLQLGIDDHIEIKPNKSIEIPILIKNYSEYPVKTNEFILIIKNYSIVNITYELKEKIVIEPKNYIKLNLICNSTEKIGREVINVEIYSTTIKIRDSKFSKFNIEILVSNDEENEELNKKFTFYPKIQLLNKLRKKMLLYIIENHFCEKSVTQIYDCLCENNWNLDKTVNQLNME